MENFVRKLLVSIVKMFTIVMNFKLRIYFEAVIFVVFSDKRKTCVQISMR